MTPQRQGVCGGLRLKLSWPGSDPSGQLSGVVFVNAGVTSGAPGSTKLSEP